MNPFTLDRKLTDTNKLEMLYVLWKKCMPLKFYEHICMEKNFLYLNRKNVLQPKVSEIINDFLDEDSNNYNEMRNNLSQYKNIFQYVYSNIFTEIIALRNSKDLISKVCSVSCLQHIKKKMMEIFGRNPQNYEGVRNEISVYEQKPIK